MAKEADTDGDSRRFEAAHPMLTAGLPALDDPSTLDRGVESRIRVLASAERLFARHGFRDTSIMDIVHDSGVSSGSIYHHYGDKSGIREALRSWYTEQLIASTHRMLEDYPADRTYEGLAHAIGAFWRWVHNHRNAARLLLVVTDPIELGPKATSLGAEWKQVVVRSLERSGVRRVTGYSLALHGIISTGGITILRMSEDSDVEPLIDELLAMLAEIGANVCRDDSPTT